MEPTGLKLGVQKGGQSGGLGAKIMGNFNLSKDSVLKLVVGQSGGTAGNDKTTSGGGGTFVIKHPYNNNASILVIAGGGGGSPGEIDFQSGNHDDGQVTNFGSRGYGQSFSLGGSNGAGGSSTNRATGGGGFYTNGSNNNQDQNYGTGGESFLNGARGGEDKYSTIVEVDSVEVVMEWLLDLEALVVVVGIQAEEQEPEIQPPLTIKVAVEVLQFRY